MNVSETSAYLNRIGLELHRARLKHCRWAIAPQGGEPWMYFNTLVQVWGFIQRRALRHFQQELAADEILNACDAGIGSRWALIYACFENEVRVLPKFTHKIIDRAAATITSLPPNWKEDYARLIEPHGRLDPYEPLLGRALHSKLIALKARNSALCQPKTERGQHAQTRCAEVD